MAIFEDSGEEEAGAPSIPWQVSSYVGKLDHILHIVVLKYLQHSFA